MATRANIELYDSVKHNERFITWHKGAMLYHHHDGYPAWMGPELTQKLASVKAILGKQGRSYWWDSERVGALIVALSADTADSVPRFQPCLRHHGDIDYIWRIFLGPEAGQYTMRCLEMGRDWDHDVVDQLTPIDWQKEAEQENKP